MSKEKFDEITELSDDIYNSFQHIAHSDSRTIAESLYNDGWRKQSEGEWVTKGDFFKTYHCSLCNYSVDYPWQRTSYCPRCGAKMGGGA